MTTLLARVARLTVLVPLALAGCELTPQHDTYDAATSPDVLQSTSAVSTELLTLNEFRGTFDPETGEFALETIPFEEWEAIAHMNDDEIATYRQQLYCNNIVVTPVAGDGSVSMATVIGSIGQTPEACIPPIELDDWLSLVYLEGGAFCAEVQITSGFDHPLRSATAEITEITSGYEGYEFFTDEPTFCCGNGANLGDDELYPDGANKPSALAGGAFAYGDIPAGASARERWVFRNAGGSFQFRGRVVARFTEILDGLDNDCDGVVDNALGQFPAGSACLINEDCESGLCEDDVCAIGCDPGFFGLDCDQVCPACTDQGECDDGLLGTGTCVCNEGWGGLICETCDDGFYGPACLPCVDCASGGVCNEGIDGDGVCTCAPGFHGDRCEFSCGDGMQNGDETAIDCGGACGSCGCSDGLHNGDEVNVDCGGSCPACLPTEDPDPLFGSILIWDGDSAGTVPSGAANDAGLDVTLHSGFSGQATFVTDLVAGGWDLVLVDNTDQALDTATRDALIAWVGGGGALILAHEDLEDFPLLQAALDVTVATDQDADREVHSTPLLDGFDMFAYPLTVSALNVFSFAIGDRGDSLTTGSGFIAASYDSSASGEGAIAVTLDRRVIVNGFVPHNLRDQDNDLDGTPDIEELYRNQFEIVLGSAPNPCVDPDDGTPLADGTTCEGPSTCATYSCLSGTCVGDPLIDGTSCDDDPTNCAVSVCEAGGCVDNPVADCTVCGPDSNGLCAGGQCNGTGGLPLYDFEGGLEADLVMDGTEPWFVSTNDSYTGAASLQSGDIGDGQVSSFAVTVELSADGEVAFWYHHDAENNWDYLRFYIDGVEFSALDGDDWEEVAAPLTAGQHVLEWAFEKDASLSDGTDTVWVDDIRITELTCETDFCGDSLYAGGECVTCNRQPNGLDCTPEDSDACLRYRCQDGSCLEQAQPDGTACTPEVNPNPCLAYLCGAGGCTTSFISAGATCDVDPFDCQTGICDGAGSCLVDLFDDCTSCGEDGKGVCAGGVCDGIVDVTYDFELDSGDLADGGGDAAWFLSTDDAFTGFQSFESGDIDDDQISSFTTTLQVGESAAISFWYATSTEANWDWLEFYVDGVRLDRWSGVTAWTQYSTVLAEGIHTLEWRYDKDTAVSGNADTVWVDDIEIVLGTICEETACGDTAWTGSECITCTAASEGLACTIEDANPCLAYSCDEGGECVGTPIADGSSCDESTTDCTVDTCVAGSCVQDPFDDCSACGDDGLGFCAAGSCNGVTAESFDAEGPIPESFVLSGDANWAATTTTANTGFGSWASGVIGNDQVSSLTYTVTLQADATLSFYYRVSSEDGWDFLELIIDDVEIDQWSGEIDWTLYAVPLTAGTHTITWEYDTDPFLTLGSNTAWIDDISIGFATICEDTTCGPALFNGVDCTYCDIGAEGLACTVSDANPCLSYSCGVDGECQGTAVADGTTCDTDPNDCQVNTCSAGTCLPTDVADCAACGAAGDGECMGGACNGVTTTFDGVEIDISGFTQATDDDADWVQDGADANTGSFSAMSADIDDSQWTSITRTVQVGTGGSVSFYYSTSCEAGFDWLEFYVNGVRVDRWTGLVDWTLYTYPLGVGTQTLEWRYVKDDLLSDNDDNARIDDLTIDLGTGLCESTECGTQYWDGAACGVCDTSGEGDPCTVSSPNECLSYACAADGTCAGTPVSAGSACTGFDPCLAFACDGAGACVGTPVADGTSCDASSTDCLASVCEAGSCVTSELSDCSACGDGSQVCVSGACGGLSDRTIDFESGLPADTTSSGDGGWLQDSLFFSGGANSARSAVINADQSSGMVLNIDLVSASSISFNYRVSSEAGADQLLFLVDGLAVQIWGGEIDWTNHVESLSAGPHVVEWRYTKDGSVDLGLDAAWVDDIVIGQWNASCDTTACGSGAFNGVDCTYCAVPGTVGDACTVSSPNPCLTYACALDGSCAGTPLADGTSCDSDAEDCRDFTCTAGVCDSVDLADCSTCGAGGTEFCAGGGCGGASDRTFTFESQFPTDVSSGSNPGWQLSTTTANGGVQSMENVDIGDNETAEFSYTVNIEASGGTVSFAYSTSSEDGWDFLRFYIDDVEMGAWSGVNAWAPAAYALTAGTHTLSWRYEKDTVFDGNSDTVWVDDIVVTSAAELTGALCVDDGCGDQRFDGESCLVCNPEADGTVCSDLGLCDGGLCDISSVLAPFHWGFEDGLVPLGVQFDGDRDWQNVVTEANGGINAMQAGAIADSQTSTFTIDVVFAEPLPYSFYYRVSSESGFDFLTVTLDGAEILSASGEVDWTQVSGSADTGTHTFAFTYAKDSITAGGLDSAWIDDFTVGFPDLPTETLVDFDTGGVPGFFQLTGDLDWFSTASESNSPDNSLQAGPITADQSTSFTATVNLSETTPLSFFYKVSSQPGADYLRFFVDGVEDTSWSGELDWTRHEVSLAAGAHELIWTYDKDGAFDVATDTAWVDDIMLGAPPFTAPVSIGFETGVPQQVSLGGDAPWFAQSDTVQAGSTAMQSGAIGDDQSSDLTFTVSLGSEQPISFWYSTSTENGFDWLEYRVNDVEIEDWSGLNGWTQHVDTLPAGTHEITFRYQKDGLLDGNADTVWIDGIIIGTPPLGAPQFFRFDDSTSLPFELTTEGDASWGVSTTVARSGANSAQAGLITNNESTTMTIEVELLESEPLSFFYKVSSESGFDFLELWVDGVRIDQWSGEVDWTHYSYDLPAGPHTISFIYTKDAINLFGQDSAWIDDLAIGTPTFGPNVLYDFEDGLVPVFVDNDPSFPWGPVTDQTFDSSGFALGPASIGDGQTSSFSMTIVLEETDTMSFYYRVSSESGGDFLTLSVDGTPIASWSGEVDWTLYSQLLAAGTHVITWDYTKDAGGTSGSDTAWLDNIVFGTAPTQAPSSFDADAGTVPAALELSGDAAWFSSTDQFFAGTNSYESGPIGDGQESTMTLVVQLSGPTPISFWHLVDSEAGSDFLNFSIDGVLQSQWSGSTAWAQHSQVLGAGTYELEWTFVKDGSVSDGADAAWVDSIEIGVLPTQPTRLFDFESGIDVNFLLTNDGGADWSQVAGGAYDLSASSAGVTLADNQTSAIVLDVTSAAAYNIAFDYATSSEAGWDFLEFWVDGVLVTSWSGETPWGNYMFPLTSGDHTVEWRYARDPILGGGSNTVWIDNVNVTP